MKLRKLALAPVAAAAMMAFSMQAGAASDTWILNYAAASGQNPGPFGEVFVNETSANTVDVTVTLYNDFRFVSTGGPHHAFAFNLADDGTAGVVAPLTAGFAAPGGGTNTPFGDFSNVIDWTGQNGGPPNGNPGPLAFTITDTGGISLSSFIGGLNPGVAGNWLFSADIWANGFTGNVAVGSSTPPIPEPETYAMMLAGLGLLGFVARRRRQGLGNSVPA